MADVYTETSEIYINSITKKRHFETLPVLEISLEGAIEFIVRSEHRYRPDLISLQAYGDSELDDFITMANKLTDPVKDYEVGAVLLIPTIEAIRSLVDGS